MGERKRGMLFTLQAELVRTTDLTIFWLVSGVANGRKASDGLTRVEQIYREKKNTAALNQLSNTCN